MSATAAALMTVEEFEQLPEDPEVKRELIEGELLEVSFGLPPHERVKSNITRPLTVYCIEHPEFWLMTETGYDYPQSRVAPDLSIVRTSDLDSASLDRIYQIPVLVPVEVVSSEPADTLERKAGVYFRNGARAMIIAYPNHRRVQLRRPNGESRYLEQDEILEIPEVLPGFRVPVASFFIGLSSRSE